MARYIGADLRRRDLKMSFRTTAPWKHAVLLQIFIYGSQIAHTMVTVFA